MDEQKGRWITTKKKHRHVFIPAGKDVGEVLKETFSKYNDDDYDFYEDGDEEEYKTYDADYEEEFDDNHYEELKERLSNAWVEYLPSFEPEVEARYEDGQLTDEQYKKLKDMINKYDEAHKYDESEEDDYYSVDENNFRKNKETLQRAEEIIFDIADGSNSSNKRAIDTATKKLVNEYKLNYDEAKKIAMKAYDNLYNEEFNDAYEKVLSFGTRPDKEKEPEEYAKYMEAYNNYKDKIKKPNEEEFNDEPNESNYYNYFKDWPEEYSHIFKKENEAGKNKNGPIFEKDGKFYQAMPDGKLVIGFKLKDFLEG